MWYTGTWATCGVADMRHGLVPTGSYDCVRLCTAVYLVRLRAPCTWFDRTIGRAFAHAATAFPI